MQLVLLDAVDLSRDVELVELALRALEVALGHVRPHQFRVAVLLRAPDRTEALGHPLVQDHCHVLLVRRSKRIVPLATEYPHTRAGYNACGLGAMIIPSRSQAERARASRPSSSQSSPAANSSSDARASASAPPATARAG